MDFVLIIGLVAVLIWGAVLVRFAFQWSINPIPLIGLLTVISGVVVGHDFYHANIGPIPITIDRLMLLTSIGLFVFLVLLGYERIQNVTKTDLLVFAFIGFMGLSTFTHEWSYRNNMPLSRLLFFHLLPVALYVVVRNARIKTQDLKLLSVCMGLLGVYLGATAFAEMNGWNWMVYPSYIMSESFEEFFGRGRGPTLNPVSNGIFITLGFCSVLMWWPHVGRRWRVAILVAAVIMGAGAFATLTRSVWLALAFSLFAILWVSTTRPVRGFLLATCVFGGLLVVPLLGDGLMSFKRDKFVSESAMEKSAELRPLFFVIAARMLQDRPLMGHGYGQYTQAKLPYLKDPASQHPLDMAKPYMQHNVILSYLTELGLFGTVLFVVLLGNLGLMGWRLWKKVDAELWIRQFGLLMCLLLICHMTNGMFHDVSIIPMENMLLFYLAGITTRLYSDRQTVAVQGLADTSKQSGIARAA